MDVNKTTVFGREWRQQYLHDTEAAVVKWLTQHSNPNSRCFGIRIYTTGSSGIGQNVIVRCLCGEGKDITDYGAW